MAIRVYPIAGAARNICSGYAMRTYPDGHKAFHYACDLCAPMQMPIVAVDDGTMSFGTDPKGGNVALLRIADGTAYYYAHMASAQSGQRAVKVGEQIGVVGMTGNAKGTLPHCHFAWWPSGRYQTPAPDPTAQLLAAPVLAEPVVPSSVGAKIALALFSAAALLGVGVGLGYAMDRAR